MIEMEVYLGLPFKFVPTFRKYLQETRIEGSPGETVAIEQTTVNP
jgi:hypothetical protein